MISEKRSNDELQTEIQSLQTEIQSLKKEIDRLVSKGRDWEAFPLAILADALQNDLNKRKRMEVDG